MYETRKIGYFKCIFDSLTLLQASSFFILILIFLLQNFQVKHVNLLQFVCKQEEQLRHERVLKMNTKDYGRYDPTPALSKPPFKLIPN